jgi:hypothetical protein
LNKTVLLIDETKKASTFFKYKGILIDLNESIIKY